MINRGGLKVSTSFGMAGPRQWLLGVLRDCTLLQGCKQLLLYFAAAAFPGCLILCQLDTPVQWQPATITYIMPSAAHVKAGWDGLT